MAVLTKSKSLQNKLLNSVFVSLTLSGLLMVSLLISTSTELSKDFGTKEVNLGWFNLLKISKNLMSDGSIEANIKIANGIWQYLAVAVVLGLIWGYYLYKKSLDIKS